MAFSFLWLGLLGEVVDWFEREEVVSVASMDYITSGGAIGREIKRSFKTYRNKKLNTLPLSTFLRHEIYSYLTFHDLRRMRCVCKMQPTTKNESMGRDAFMAIQTLTAGGRFMRVFIPYAASTFLKYDVPEVCTIIDDRKATQRHKGRLVCQHIVIIPKEITEVDKYGHVLSKREYARKVALEEHMANRSHTRCPCKMNVPFDGQTVVDDDCVVRVRSFTHKNMVQMPLKMYGSENDPPLLWKRDQYSSWTIKCFACERQCTHFFEHNLVDTRALFTRQVVERMRIDGDMPAWNEKYTKLFTRDIINASVASLVSTIARRSDFSREIVKLLKSSLEEGKFPFRLFCPSCLYGSYNGIESLAELCKRHKYKRLNLWAFFLAFPSYESVRVRTEDDQLLVSLEEGVYRMVCYPDELNFS